jgi:hypothetical protein
MSKGIMEKYGCGYVQDKEAQQELGFVVYN